MNAAYDLPYTRFALPYSLTSEIEFSEKMAKLTLELMAPMGDIDCKHIIDIACGVGAACFYFAKLGYQVSGVDISKDMLDAAKRSLARQNCHIDWFQQDMRELCIPKKAELITCMYDSLNFMLNPQELTTVFQKVFNLLNPKGVFIFDMYTILGLSMHWGEGIEEIHTNETEHFIASNTSWDADTRMAVKTLYGFSQSDEVWHRWEERHQMHAFSLEEIKESLIKSGFTNIKPYGLDGLCLTDLSNETKRTLIVARKS